MLITLDLLDNWDFNNLFSIEVRSNICYSNYLKFKNDLKVNNIELKDYLLEKYLNDKPYNLVPNEFPYAVGENMAHYVLWVHPRYVNKLTDIEIIQIIKQKMENPHSQYSSSSSTTSHKPESLVELNFNEYMCFENDIRIKSVLDIPHYHVFFRRC